MFDIDRILAIPDESIDYLQCGIAGKERAALAARGFVRKDGTKAKDYMIRTIQKTEKNKAKAEKAVIKGDKKLSALEQFQKTQPFVNALTDGESIVAVTPKGRKLEISYNKKDGYIRPHAVIKNLDNPSQEVVKNPMTKDQLHTYIANFEDVKIKPQSTKKIAITYNKQGDLSEGVAAKKIKGAIAQRRPPKASEDLDRNLRLLAKSERELEEANATPYPKEKKGKDVYKNMMDSEARSEIAAMKGRAKDYFKSDAKRVVEDFNRHPSRQAFIKKQYGSLESDTVPRDKKGMIDYLAMAKDFAKSPYAQKSIKSRKVVKGTSPRDRGVEPVASSLIKKAKNEQEFLNLVDRAKAQSEKAVKSSTKNISSAVKKAIADMPKSFASSEEKNAYREKISDLIKSEVDKGINDHFKFSPYKSKVELKDAPQDFLENLNTKDLQRWSTRKVRQISTAGQKASQDFYKAYGAIPVEKQSKPKQEPTRAQKLGMTEAEYEAFKKKVKRL